MKTQILGILSVLAIVVAFVWVSGSSVQKSAQSNITAVMTH